MPFLIILISQILFSILTNITYLNILKKKKKKKNKFFFLKKKKIKKKIKF